MIEVIQFIVIAICAGFLGSLVGLGGGLIVTPALTILFGIDIKYAIGASIVAVIATSSGSAIAFVKDHVSNMRVGMLLEIFTTAGGVIGALMAGIFSSKLLYIFFSLILLNAFYGMLKKTGLITKKRVEEKVENDKYAEKYKVIRVKREEEFAPIKNKEGKDSLDSAALLYLRYVRMQEAKKRKSREALEFNI